jgi:23S rRNA (guanosine2251-2'-O)-methyltransferase
MRKLANEELNRLSSEEFRDADKRKLIIILDNVRSLNNVGSVFRTADAFLVEAIYLCGITGTPPNKEIYKTALGADETVSWQYFATTMKAVEACKQNGYAVYSVEQAEGSIMLNNFTTDNDALALVFGNEVNGVDIDVINASAGCIEIPQDGSKHSLNISVSVGIVVWQVVKT